MGAYRSAREAAEYCGVSETTIRNWLAAGRLTADKSAGSLRIPQEQLDAIRRAGRRSLRGAGRQPEGSAEDDPAEGPHPLTAAEVLAPAREAQAEALTRAEAAATWRARAEALAARLEQAERRIRALEAARAAPADAHRARQDANLAAPAPGPTGGAAGGPSASFLLGEGGSSELGIAPREREGTMAREEPRRGMVDVRDIRHGWAVYGADGEKVGDVSDVREAYIVVSKGLIFTSERYVPASAIARVEYDRVYLDVTKDEIEARGWDRAPAVGGVAEERRAGVRAEDRPARREGEETVELREEELRARKERVQAGEVQVRKEVVEEEKTLEVPVTREEVFVERHAVERRPSDAPIGEGERIEVPVYEEEVTVEKRPVVYEEVTLGKQAVQETERVSDTVRREEARVETEGDVGVVGAAGVGGRGRAWEEVGPSYRQDWERRHGTAGGRWEDVEPGYRYAHEMRSDPRYQGRDWGDVEADLRADYAGWSRRRGYRGDRSTWEELRDNVREAWDAARGRRRGGA